MFSSFEFNLENIRKNLQSIFLKYFITFEKLYYICRTKKGYAYHLCPDGEIGKRCGLRSRWSKILESSSLSSGTLNGPANNVLQDHFFFMVI